MCVKDFVKVLYIPGEVLVLYSTTADLYTCQSFFLYNFFFSMRKSTSIGKVIIFFSFLYNSFDATVLFDDVFRPISTAPSLNVIDSVYRWSYPSYGCITLLISKFLYLISLWLHLYHVKVIYILL